MDKVFSGFDDLFYRDDKPPELFNRGGVRVTPTPKQLEKIALLDAALTGERGAFIEGVGRAWRGPYGDEYYQDEANRSDKTWFTIGYQLHRDDGDTS